jgi:hypothetical protein
MSDESRVLHRGSERYVLVPRGSKAPGAVVPFADRQTARAFLANLAAEPGNREVLRAAVKALGGAVPSGFGGRPDEDAWAPLTEALARGSLEALRLIDHPVTLFPITTTGKLTLSEVSWGETSSIYPTAAHLYRPDQWDQGKLGDLLKARAAVTDVATRNSDVRRASPSAGRIDQLMRPYHCIENFPKLDPEIDRTVKWFFLSANAATPAAHPKTTGTKLVKSYGPFHNVGGGDVTTSTVYLLFYNLA